MLNLGESADRALPERVLPLAADRTSGSMTLSERVHGLFEQLHVPVFRYLLRKTRDSGRAEDTTQETFLRLFRHLRENRLLDNPKAWIFTVANNLAVDASRNESHRRGNCQGSYEAHHEQAERQGSHAVCRDRRPPRHHPTVGWPRRCLILHFSHATGQC